MAAPTRTPREKWIEEALGALGVGGPDAVRIETLARALGVTKGGFYWHFDDRSALLAETLDTWERVMVDEAIAYAEAEDRDARGKLRRLFALAGSIPGMLEVELAIRNWARGDKAVARRLKRVDNRRIEYLRAQFAAFCVDEEDVEIRCFLAMSVFVASEFIAADHGSYSRRDVQALAMRRLLE